MSLDDLQSGETDNSRNNTEIIVPISQLTIPTIQDMFAIYKEIFGRGPDTRQTLFDAHYVLEMLDPTSVGIAELRYGAILGSFTNPHSKFRAHRRFIAPEDENDDFIPVTKFHFDPNLDTTINYEKQFVEIAAELTEEFKRQTSARLIELGIASTVQNDQLFR